MIVTMNIEEQLKVKQEAKLMADLTAFNLSVEDRGEIDGYKVTAEQLNKINAGDREAVDMFFEDNGLRLRRLARVFLLRNGIKPNFNPQCRTYNPTIIEIGDCLNQLYVDMRQGLLKFVLVPKVIGRVISHSFSYCGVGGFGDEDGVYVHKLVRSAIAGGEL